jgi:hypothetical protein
MKIFVKAFLSFSFVCTFCAAGFCQGAYVYKGLGELSLYGGISVSNKDKPVQGVNLEYGGSGYNTGLTALIYFTDHIAAGVDFFYADNRYGKTENIGGNNYKAATEHVTPMLTFKGQLFPDSRFRVYLPLGIGADVMRVSVVENGNTKNPDTDSSVGLAFMAGLGAEIDLAPGSFAGIEARYNYSDFFGRSGSSLSGAGVYNILFKVGIRFQGDIFD